jgi:hypothetical protein
VSGRRGAVGSSEPTASPSVDSSPTAEPVGGEPEHRLAVQSAPSDGCGVDVAASPIVTPTPAPLVVRDIVATATSAEGETVSVSVPGEVPFERVAITGAAAVARAVTLLEVSTPASTVDAAALADTVADRVIERIAARGGARGAEGILPLLVDYGEAARLLGIEVGALRVRVSGGKVPNSCIKRTGRRVQFIRSRLVEWLDGRDRRGA